MATYITNLYPPVIDTFMPSFVASDSNGLRIYFSLSLYNDVNSIKNVQVTVRNQKTNINALNLGRYPSQIAIKELEVDDTKITPDKYYITLTPNDMIDNYFITDQDYKVQIRFTDISVPEDVPNQGRLPQKIDTWLVNNLDYFSEWSSVCLIRGISDPYLVFRDFETGVTSIHSTMANLRILARLKFKDLNETEYLHRYRIRIYHDDANTPNGVLIADSGDLYTNNNIDVNLIDYTVKYDFDEEDYYWFTIDYTTNNGYYWETKEEEAYGFYIEAGNDDKMTIVTSLTEDEENGCFTINVSHVFTEDDFQNGETFKGAFIIRRASLKDNFKVYEDMHIQNIDIDLTNDITEEYPEINYSWSDYTIESGVFYQYTLQVVDEHGSRYSMKKINEEPIMLVFEHAYLTGENKQLKIEFNPQINSFKHTLSEAKIDTIGSKYPFIKRNGYVDYIQFPLSGLISSAMDESGTFTTKEETFGTALPLYEKYNEDHDIPIWRDIVWEKAFREKVIDFLQADDVKLFRSPTEGNILVRLMDTQFQPNQTLGRRLWSFSTNAYEIDDCTFDNYKKYHIYNSNGNDFIYSDGSIVLAPIKRIVFIDNLEDFPAQGKKYVLYVYNKDFYLWDEETQAYLVISVPIWRTEPYLRTDYRDSSSNLLNTLYTDQFHLYVWDKDKKEFVKLSEEFVNSDII